jgi:predicted nucleic acid-binding protein
MAIAIDPIVAVDTMSLIWGLRGQGPKEKCKLAQWLFRQFTIHKTQVVLPSIVVSEYLTAEPDASKHANIIAELDKRFLIFPFDQRCASTAAILFRKGQALRTKGKAGGRPILRADSMIISVAKEYGARTIYSHDAAFRSLAKTVMKSSDLPEPDTDMFGNPLE